MSDKQRSEKLKGYRAYGENSESSRLDSFFGGKLFKELKETWRLFKGEQDLAMFLTTDAVKVFKSRKEFKCQPIAAVSLPLRASVFRARQVADGRPCAIVLPEPPSMGALSRQKPPYSRLDPRSQGSLGQAVIFLSDCA